MSPFAAQIFRAFSFSRKFVNVDTYGVAEECYTSKFPTHLFHMTCHHDLKDTDNDRLSRMTPVSRHRHTFLQDHMEHEMHSVQIYELNISTENIILLGKRFPGCSWTTWSRVGGNTDNGPHGIMCRKL